MRTMIAAILLMSYAATAEAQNGPDGGATCKASLTGNVLTTVAEYSSGYRVEAPWRVVGTRAVQRRATNVTATLDHIVETDPVTGKRQRTEMPGPIEMTFKGETSGSMLESAADIWCTTVAKALAAQPTETTSRVAQNRVIM